MSWALRPKDVVVVERFVIHSIFSGMHNEHTLETIGAIRWIADYRECEFHTMDRYAKKLGKSVVDLKKWRFHNQDRHQYDAVLIAEAFLEWTDALNEGKLTVLISKRRTKATLVRS